MDFVEIEKGHEYKHDFLAESILTPGVNMTDCNRLQMFNSHIAQTIQIEGSEPPLFFTNFENQVGEYSTGYKKLEGSWEVIDKITKNHYQYILLMRNTKNGMYDILFRNETEWFTEHYGSKLNNSVFDSLEKGDIVEDEILYKDNNYDDEMNFKYGTNLNAVYMAYGGKTNEDAVVVSKSTAEKMSTYFINKVMVSVNTNDLLINLYGNNKKYKSFPDIGEDVINGRLLSRRRVAYDKVMSDLKDLRKVLTTDDTYYVDGKVIDINVYCNSDINILKERDRTYQVYKYLEDQRTFYESFVDRLKNIVEGKNKKKYTQNLLYYYNRYKMFLDDKKCVYQGKLFDNYIIEFTVLERRPLLIGSKTTGTYGNKGVVSLILPDDEMPHITKIDGKPVREDTNVNLRADVILNPLGVINRLNPSQLIQMEVNYISKIIRYRLEEMLNNGKSVDEIIKMLLLYVSSANQDESSKMEEFLSSLNDREKLDFIKEIIKKGIPIHQPPFWNNITINDLASLYEKWDVNESICGNIKSPLIIGEEYFLRLKHETDAKFSARSTGLNNLRDLPSKGRSFKENKEVFSKTPIRIGEMETMNLNLTKSMDSVKCLLDSYANNKADRDELITNSLTGDPFDIKFKPTGSKSNNSKIIKSFMNSIGIDIVDD